MAKEPAGLRRWRLAHRKHKRKRRVYSVAKRRRHYYGRKRKGGRKSKAFPILMAAPVIPGFIAAYDRRANPKDALVSGVYTVSGVDITGQQPINMANVTKTVGLVIIGLVGHKVANKTGINRIMKKATLGYLQL